MNKGAWEKKYPLRINISSMTFTSHTSACVCEDCRSLFIQFNCIWVGLTFLYCSICVLWYIRIHPLFTRALSISVLIHIANQLFNCFSPLKSDWSTVYQCAQLLYFPSHKLSWLNPLSVRLTVAYREDRWLRAVESQQIGASGYIVSTRLVDRVWFCLKLCVCSVQLIFLRGFVHITGSISVSPLHFGMTVCTTAVHSTTDVLITGVS